VRLSHPLVSLEDWEDAIAFCDHFDPRKASNLREKASTLHTKSSESPPMAVSAWKPPLLEWLRDLGRPSTRAVASRSGLAYCRDAKLDLEMEI
jgi:hypothetical protein